MRNLLNNSIDEYAHSDNDSYIENNVSFQELRVVTNFFFTRQGFTSDDLWNTYNSENREMITNIPLIKSFIKDCSNEKEIEELIRSLVK